jgi:hypothetical protein
MENAALVDLTQRPACQWGRHASNLEWTPEDLSLDVSDGGLGARTARARSRLSLCAYRDLGRAETAGSAATRLDQFTLA